MTVREETVEAVLASADEGIDFDGLRVRADEDGYHLQTPTLELEGVDAPTLVDALDPVAQYVTNWRFWRETVGGDGTARRSFLRWCERAPTRTSEEQETDQSVDPVTEILDVPARYAALADGIDRSWGELRVTARLIDEDEPHGTRVYDLWHRADEGRDLTALEVFDDSRAARELATHDAKGRYRPLKTAPSLVSGWAFTGLSGAELVETIDQFYPATIANWHRERRGELDVDHWLETAQRQSGIYDVVDELPREAVDWLAAACCVDSQCLRRREWHYDDEDELDVDGGDGPFPCREPCSLVIAAARQWAILESERERTWTLELTTSELNQLSELIDAVADDRVAQIREADLADGANRYRARYLRAKRFTDGSLAVDELDES